MRLNVFGIVGVVFLFIAVGSFARGEAPLGWSFLSLGIVFLVFFGLKKKGNPTLENDE